jgi:hypothetical protein
MSLLANSHVRDRAEQDKRDKRTGRSHHGTKEELPTRAGLLPGKERGCPALGLLCVSAGHRVGQSFCIPFSSGGPSWV